MSRAGGKWWVVVTMALPLFMLAADINGVTVALPKIGDDLDASTTSLQWLINSYLLAFAAFLLPMGRFGDIFGRRLILVGGLSLFGLASIAAGISPNEGVLILARAVQGVGAAMFFSTSLSLVSAAFPPAERSKGIGIWSALGVSGAAAGPLVGGFLTDALSWRWFFLVNVPISVAGVLMALVFVPESRDTGATRRIDYPGFATALAGLIGVVLGIQRLSSAPFLSAEVALPIALGAVLLAAFVIIERRRSEPMIDLSLFRGRDFLTSGIVGAISQWLFFSTAFLVTLYLQNVLGLTPLEAGLVFLSLALPFVASSLLTDRIAQMLGLRIGMSVGIGLMGVGALIIAFAGTDKTSGVAIVVIAYVIFGFGNALAYNVSTSAGMSAVDDARAGAASGVLSSSKFVTGALGLAIVGAIFTSVENNDLANAAEAAGLQESQRSEVEGLLSGSEAAMERLSDLAPGLASMVEQVTDEAFVTALSVAMWVNVAVGAIGVVIGLLYRTPTGDPEAAARADIDEAAA